MKKQQLSTIIQSYYRTHEYQEDDSHNMNSLPGRLVVRDDIKYYIHGVIHDSLFCKTTEEYRQALKDVVEGWDIICEDGFTDYFGNVPIFNEIKTLKLATPLKLLKILPQVLLAYLTRSKQQVQQIDLKQINNINDLRQIRRRLFKRYLPQPFGMDMIEFINPKSVALRRYQYEAQRAIEYAREHNLKELHIIVGCAHEQPLEYLLINETYN